MALCFTGRSCRGYLLALLAGGFTLYLSTSAAAPSSWVPADLPPPQDDVRRVCGHGGRRSAVCDPDGMLSDDAVKTIDGLANFIAEGSHGFALMQCATRHTGYQVAVAVIRTMRDDGLNLDARAKKFAKDLHNSWGVGDAECNNGVLLLVALDDRRMYISTGSGAKKLLTDARTQQVFTHIKPLLRNGRVDRALEAAVNDIGKILAGGQIPQDAESSGFGIGFLVATVFVIGVIYVGSVDYRNREQYKRCQAALRRLEGDRALARQSQYECISCPICLEEFDRTSPPPSPTAHEASSMLTEDPPHASGNSKALPASGAESSHFIRRTIAGAASSTTYASTVTCSDESRENVGALNPACMDEPSTVRTSGRTVSDSGLGTWGPNDSSISSPIQTIIAGGKKGPAKSNAQGDCQVLRCGHKFHSECLRTMVQASYDQCCVCRRPLFGRASGINRDETSQSQNTIEDADEHGPSSSAEDSAVVGRARDWTWFYPEYIFRLHRARDMYPRYITLEMIDRWGQRDTDAPLQSDRAFQALDPSIATSARQSGSHGSSFSFGGGGSSGGGGGGSSW